MENIVLGIVSGLFTSLLLFVWYVLVKKVINPWLENRLYKGVVLEGTWVGKRVAHYKMQSDKKNVIHDELNLQLELEQSGYKISGIFSAESVTADKDGEENYKNIYKVKGCIHDNFALFEYHPHSRKRTGLGSFLMEVKNGGKTMTGNITFLEEGDMEIVTLQNAVINRVGLD